MACLRDCAIGTFEFFQRGGFDPSDFHRSASSEDLQWKKTHIVCTMGPACSDVETVVRMIDAGMNVCRFNFSHGTHASHKQMLDVINEAKKQRPNANIGLMLDTKGPEIRTGFLKNHEPVELQAGQLLTLTTDYNFLGDATKIACSYPKLVKSLKVGDVVLIADGTISCQVTAVHEDKNEVEVHLKNSAVLGERKNMNLPNVKVELPILSEKDKDDILNFALKYEMDFIALSFTQCADDVLLTRKLLGEAYAEKIRIIPKIENIEGLMNYDEILEVADGIMIARGDLGMEIALEKVSLAQKMMITKANKLAKPIITATQMLESMVKNSRPTRAEAADVVNAVLDGTDCVMLSGETAGGKQPIACVEFMAKLCFEAERSFIQPTNMMEPIPSRTKELCLQESISKAAVQLSNEIDAALIICFSLTGKTARFLCKYRPNCMIIAICKHEHVIKGLTLCRGVWALKKDSFDNPNEVIGETIQQYKQHGYCAPGSFIVALFGLGKLGQTPVSDILRIIKVE